MENKYTFQDKAPYPDLCIAGKNPEYAQAMLSNVGDVDSEMSAISRYLYNSTITGELFEEISTCFHRIMIVEMHHLDLYGRLAMMLGVDPRLWSCQDQGMVYWSPSYNTYPGRVDLLLENAIKGEEDTIRKYTTQAEWIRDCHIKAILNRVILDEKLHIFILKDLLKRWNENEMFC